MKRIIFEHLPLDDPAFVRIRNRDLLDGRHRNDTKDPDYFTTAYFHRPEDLRAELSEAGFHDVTVLGVEGPARMLPDFDSRWSDLRSAEISSTSLA